MQKSNLKKTDPVLSKLNRIEGQVGAIKRMYEEGKECEDIVQQVQAARSALGRVVRDLLTNEACKCAKSAKKSKNFDRVIKNLLRI